MAGDERMTPDDPRHGTSAGYQRHRKDDEPACGPCRAAQAEKTRRFREDPVRRLQARQMSKAQHRAAWRLVDEHREAYEQYYAEELAAVRGWRVVGKVGDRA